MKDGRGYERLCMCGVRIERGMLARVFEWLCAEQHRCIRRYRAHVIDVVALAEEGQQPVVGEICAIRAATRAQVDKLVNESQAAARLSFAYHRRRLTFGRLFRQEILGKYGTRALECVYRVVPCSAGASVLFVRRRPGATLRKALSTFATPPSSSRDLAVKLASTKTRSTGIIADVVPASCYRKEQ